MTTATRQAIRSVWIVTVGSLYEGGYVESVHETREGAMLVVEALLADGAEGQ